MPTLRQRAQDLKNDGRTSPEVKVAMEKAFGVKAEELIPYMDTEISEIKEKLKNKTPIRQPSSSGRYKQCSDDSLKMGCAGDNVQEIQGYLAKSGYNLGRYGEDGKFGRFTKSAVIEFQKDNNLSPTGVVDNNTLEKLKSGTSSTVQKEKDIEPEKSEQSEQPEQSVASEPIRDVLDLRQQMYYGEKVFEKMGVSPGNDMTQAKIALEKILNKNFRDVSRQITVKEIIEAAKEVKENFPGLFSGTVSESVQNDYYINPIKNRHNQIEKLVFERLVKGCK